MTGAPGQQLRVDVRVDGLRKLQRALRSMPAELAQLKEANAAAARIVAAGASTRAPRRTGRLAGSVRGNRAAGRATVSAGSARLPYAGPIHWGWPARHITAHPFIADAAVELQPTWLPAYEHDVQNVVDRRGGTY